MKPPRVVSFYTNDYYRTQAEAMAASAEAVGLSVTLYARPHKPTWWENTNQKCEVVLEALASGDPVIFSDADTRYLSFPSLVDGLDADVAAYFCTRRGPSGGFVWFNGRRALPYVQAWVKNVTEHPEREDDSINFSQALWSVRPSRVHRLPPAYNWNEKSMRSFFPGAVPVVEHSFAGQHDYPVE